MLFHNAMASILVFMENAGQNYWKQKWQQISDNFYVKYY